MIRAWPLSDSGTLIPEVSPLSLANLPHSTETITESHIDPHAIQTRREDLSQQPLTGSYQLLYSVAEIIQSITQEDHHVSLAARKTPTAHASPFHSFSSLLPTDTPILPIPLPPIPQITIPPAITQLALQQEIPSFQDIPVEMQSILLPFGEDVSEQARNITQFFHVILELARYSQFSSITKLLQQLGRDYQKYHLQLAEIYQIIDYWQMSFHPVGKTELIQWIGTFSRPLIYGLAEYIPVYSARITDIIHPENNYIIIQLLAEQHILFSSGQYIEVLSSRHPDIWRYCSIASPANPLGQFDIHLRGENLFSDAEVNDLWYIGQIHGKFPNIVSRAQQLTLIGIDIGLTPLRSIILDEYLYHRNTPIRLITITPEVDWYEHELFEEISRQAEWFGLWQIHAPEGKISQKEFLSCISSTEDQFILSGPPEISLHLRKLLLEHGVRTENISLIENHIYGINYFQ